MHKALQLTLQEMLDDAVAQGIARGAQVAVYHRGAPAASAWAGTADADNAVPVDEDTLFPVFSVTKGIAAALIHRMAHDGRLAYDAPICKYWPAFGQNGKEAVTLRQVLAHTSGVTSMPNDMTREEIDDWETACRTIEGLAPLYTPGTQIIYHAMTFGWILGEAARRADGRTFDQIFREEIAAPLGLSAMHMRVDADLDARVAYLTETDPPQPPAGPFAQIPASVTPLGAYRNIPASRRTCQPASSGMMSAASLARFYAALLPGGVDGVTLLPQAVLDIAAAETSGLPNPDHRTLGFVRTGDSVGHGGYGGATGFVNRAQGYAFGFTHNHFSPESSTLPARLSEVVAAALDNA